MGLWEACLLGAIQGLTEFLPISSSGHLVIARHFLPGPTGDPVAVEVALHVGTLIAVLVYFASDLWGLARGVVRPGAGPAHARQWVGLIALATLPGLLTYLAAGPWIQVVFESPVLVGANLLLTAAVLAGVARTSPGRREEGDVRPLDALVIGAAQGAALMPGISRSGMTIGAGLLGGLRGEVAARFSFLMAIPAIVGAELVNLPFLLKIPSSGGWTILAGMAVAALTGWLAIDFMLRLVRRGKLGYFSIYCAVAGALTVGTGLKGW
jgi:undecaprenyl-diphosphatase